MHAMAIVMRAVGSQWHSRASFWASHIPTLICAHEGHLIVAHVL